jgi:type II secretory pathway pseudopilin PulG
MRKAPSGHREAGESLIELVISIVILSTAAVAVFAGVTVSIMTADRHRKEVSASVYVRDYAESIESTVAAGGYASGTGVYPAYTPGAGYTATSVLAQCGPGTGATPWTACSAATEVGLPRLTLKVSSTDGRASEQLVVIVRKPCGVGSACT